MEKSFRYAITCPVYPAQQLCNLFEIRDRLRLDSFDRAVAQAVVAADFQQTLGSLPHRPFFLLLTEFLSPWKEQEAFYRNPVQLLLPPAKFDCSLSPPGIQAIRVMSLRAVGDEETNSLPPRLFASQGFGGK